MSFRRLLPCLTAWLALFAFFAVPAFAQLNPDPCTQKLTPGTVQELFLANAESHLRWTAGSLTGKKVVLIANGNGYSSLLYEPLADHLAENGFIVAMYQRSGASSDPATLLLALDRVLDHFGFSPLDAALKIGLIGHSMGGSEVIDAAKMNTDQGIDLPIRAVVALAPSASLTSWIDGDDAAAFLTLYGSQDDDMSGFTPTVKEAFRSYDTCGTESATTCTAPPCLATGAAFQKNMVYIYGADHAGLVGIPVTDSYTPQDLDYLSAGNTFCITKAYVTGFLRQHLWGDSAYRGMLRGDWKPLSFAFMTTAEADGYGNPAGSPLRLFFQHQPVQHYTIQSFGSGLGTYSKSADLIVSHSAVGTGSQAPTWVRHRTGLAQISWDASAAVQWVRFAVPASAKNGSTFSHFSLRIGQLGGAPAPFNNPVNANQTVYLAFEDGSGATNWQVLNGIPAPDRYTDSGSIRAHSHMSTRRIALSAIAGINTGDIRNVYLYFPEGSHGSLLVDSLEWHRD